MLFIPSKKPFSLSRYSNFAFLSSPHDFPVDDVINCLNKNLITHFVWYPEKEKRYDTETLSVDKVLNKEHLYGKSCWKCALKTSPKPIFNFGK